MQDEKNHLLKPSSQPTNGMLSERQVPAMASSYFAEPPAIRPELEEDEIDLLEYWRILLKRKWTIFTVLLIVVVAAVTATFLTQPIYKASLVLQIQREPQRIVDFKAVDQTDSSWLDYESFYQTQYQLLKSRSLADRVVEMLSLADNPVFTGADEKPSYLSTAIKAVMDTVFPSKEPSQQESEPFKPDYAAMLLGNLGVEPFKESWLVKLSYESSDKELATRIVNTLADAYIKMSLERRFDSASYAKEFLEERLQQVRARLEDSERMLADYARKEQIINLNDRQSMVNKTLEETNSALSKVEQERMQAEAIYKQSATGQGVTKVLENNVIEKLKGTKADLEAQYQEQLSFFKPGYPKMQQLQARIIELQAKIDAETAAVRNALKADYETAKTNESLLRARLDSAKNDAMQLLQRSIAYNILRREVDTNSTLYDGLLQRYKEVGIAGGIGANNITVVDKAQIPQFPYKPRLMLNLALALILGMFGGIALAFALESLDNTVNKTEDMERYLGIATLGVIPLIGSRGRGQQSGPVALLSISEPRSALAEAYRSVRTALQFSTSEGSPRVLAVTSAVAQEGKTTTVLSLAIAFAQTGKKVLLIDADLRNPSLHRTLNLDNSIGLTHYLAGEAEPSDISRAAILPTLFVVTSGTLSPNPAELLSSAKMLSLLSLASERFDQVILDCPPVLGLADALILGNMADGTLLVVHAGHTHRDVAQGALKRLRNAKVHLLGGLMSKVTARHGSYEYYHSHYYYYGHDQKTSGSSKEVVPTVGE